MRSKAKQSEEKRREEKRREEKRREEKRREEKRREDFQHREDRGISEEVMRVIMNNHNYGMIATSSWLRKPLCIVSTVLRWAYLPQHFPAIVVSPSVLIHLSL